MRSGTLCIASADTIRVPSPPLAHPLPPLSPSPLRFRANRYDSDENVPPSDHSHSVAKFGAETRDSSASARGGGRASGGGGRRRSSGSSRAPVGSLESLYDTFLAFANYGVRGGETTDTMDGAKWAKFCRESGLQNRRSLGPVQVDIIFSKVKRKGERRIAFEEFKDAVAMVAEMRKQTFTDVCMLIVTRGGPQSHGTRAEYVKFADPSNFTGAYAANLGMASKGRHKADASWKRKMPRIEPSDDLRRVFSVFNAFGGGNPSFMEGKTFIKLLRDCGLIDGQVRDARGRRFTPTAADLIFTKVKPKGERVIEMDDFVLALQLVADECGAPYEYVHDFVCGVDEPSNNGGTVGEYNKFYDDKDLYTGAYAAQFGVQKRPRAHREWREDRKRSSATPPDVPGLKSVFNAFCTFGGGAPGAMDNVKFVKCCKDSRLITRKFSTTDADLVFTKTKARGERRLSYPEFRWACSLIAESIGTTYERVTDAMVRAGPTSSGTHAEYTKFYDDKNTYTGSHAAVHRVEKARREKKHWRDGRPPPSDEDAPGLRGSYRAFCSFGGGNGVDMNIKSWAKLVNETGLITRRFTMTSADIIFAKVAEGQKLLTYEDFLYMLDMVAEEKGVAFEDVAVKVGECDPGCSGTKAAYNKFYDDQILYTGAYAAKFGVDSAAAHPRIADHHAWKDDRARPRNVDGIEEVFDAYCTLDGGTAGSMGIATWEKLCEDCGVIKGRLFTEADADAVFSKVCAPRTPGGHVLDNVIGYVDFKWALDLAAEKRGVSYEELCEMIMDGGGPGGGAANPYY